jgi:hypothetical protein
MEAPCTPAKTAKNPALWTCCGPNLIKANGWLPQAVGGLTLGADPIAFAIGRESLATDMPIDTFIVRKETKKHGMGRFIEGLEETQGCRVVILDDVCTTGDSTALAIEKARDAGMEILGAICLVDREAGATELLKSKFGCARWIAFSSCRIFKPTRMNLDALRGLLNQPYSDVVCTAILHETSVLYREPGVNRCFP